MRQIKEGDVIPKFYGISHLSLTSCEAICFPIPFNLIIRWFRNIWIILIQYPENCLERRIYKKGYEAGLKQGKLESYI